MLGAIIGDIVGSTYEVDECNAIKTEPDKKRSYESRIEILNPNTSLFLEDSSYTDDTALTIAIANSLLKNIPFEESLRTYGKKEINLGKDKYGRSRFGKGFVSWLNHETIGNSYGNGASMRISPIAYYYDDLSYILEKTEDATIPSHDHEEAINGAKAVSSAIYFARNNYSKQQIKEEITRLFGYDLSFNLDDLQHNYRFTSRTSNTIPQAIYCFLESNNFEDCLRKSLSIGGDADTIACVACAIAESYYGIPEELKEKALTYLPEDYKKIVNEFYQIINLKKILLDLEICHDEFWEYMKSHTKRIDAPFKSGIWGAFPSIDDFGNISKIRIIVPPLTTEQNLLVNIHEYAHAYELYLEMNTEYLENTEKREAFAISKEEEYLSKKKTYEQS